MIAWSIQAALGASIGRVIVSTDDDEIASVAATLGAEVPFRRPAHLCDDVTPSGAAGTHALSWVRDRGDRPDYVLILQPTSPLRTAVDISASLAIALDLDADAVVSVTPASHHPAWTRRISDDGLLLNFTEEVTASRRQDLPPAFALNGAIYLAKADLVASQASFVGPRTYAYVMPPERSLDVDTPWELHLADLVLRDADSARARDIAAS